MPKTTESDRPEDDITPPKPEGKIAPVGDYPERPYKEAVSAEHKKWLKDNGYPLE